MTNPLIKTKRSATMQTTNMSNALFVVDRQSFGVVRRRYDGQHYRQQKEEELRKGCTGPIRPSYLSMQHSHQKLILSPPPPPPPADHMDSPPLKPLHKMSPTRSPTKQRKVKSSLIGMLDIMLGELEDDVSGTDDNEESDSDDYSCASSGSYGSLSFGDDSITYIDDSEDETDTSFSSTIDGEDEDDDDEEDDSLFGSNSSFSFSAATSANSEFNASQATFATFSITESAMSTARRSAELNSGCGTGKNRPRKVVKHVQFSEFDEIIEIPDLDSYSKRELNAMFMDRAEARAIRRENHRLIQQMEKGIVLYDLCTRGLEKHTAENNESFREKLDMLYSAVFKIQAISLPGGMMDVPATIAGICRSLTKASVDEARQHALSDALEAKYHIGINMPLPAATKGFEQQ